MDRLDLEHILSVIVNLTVTDGDGDGNGPKILDPRSSYYNNYI